MGRRIVVSVLSMLVWAAIGSPVLAQNGSTALTGKKLDRYVAPLIDLQVFSGTILVARGDKVVLERSYGFADVENEIPNRSTTVFRIASISKPFTKALVGRLVDQKILKFEDTISRWLPAVPSADRITIRMLLDHRAGIPNINSLPYDEEAFEPNSLARLVDSIGKNRLDFEPGSRTRYSNGGYAVLARVIELATREAFEKLLEREVLRPLRLNHTHHEADGEIVNRLARGYMPSPGVGNRLVRAPFQEMNTKIGGGSLVATSRDLVAWARSIGRSPLLKPATWAELFPTKDSAFAFQGRAPGFNVILVHNRRLDITTVVLANNYSAGMVADVAAAAEAIVRGSIPGPLTVTSPVKPDSARARLLAGKYSIPESALPLPPGTNVEIRVSGHDLIAYLGTVPVDVLVPQGPGRYLARALWSMVEAPPSGDSLVIRALYRDSKFTATRIRQ